MTCAHCGNLITGEAVTKKSTGKQYLYYRCTMYNVKDHPRIRVTERELDEQILAFFKSIEQPEDVKDWFREWSKNQSGQSQERTQQLQRELTQLRQQKDRLLNLRLLDEIDAYRRLLRQASTLGNRVFELQA